MAIVRKLWWILPRGRRRSVVLLALLMLIGMVLEILGVGMVIPALALMSQPDVAVRYTALAPWLARLGNPSRERLVIMGMIALVVVYTVKAVFVGFLASRQARFVFSLQANLSERLFAGYLRQPYAFHLQRNSAQLIRNTIAQVSEVSKVVQMGLILLTEVLVLLGIAALLLAVEPLGALLVVSTVGVAGTVFVLMTRGRILRWGMSRHVHEGLRLQHMQQGLGGVKDVKLLGRESDFVAQYQRHNLGSAHVGQRQSTLEALPRLFLELLAVVGLAVLVIVMIVRGEDLGELVPTLGVFAAGAFRLMPSVNRVLTAIHAVRFYLPVIDTLHAELRLLEVPPPKRSGGALPFDRLLTLEDVTFRYEGANGPALRNVNIEIPRGFSVGFVGTTGAGKSTLVDVILGLLAPDSGAVKVDGLDVQMNPRAWQDQIGYVPQSIYLTDDTIRRNIAFGLPATEIDETAVWRAIRAAQLETFVNELPQGLDTIVGERGIRLSGGQRQRIGIARALYHDPVVLVLDEATSALDAATERGVMEAVTALQGEKTIIIVAHRTTTVGRCHKLFRLDNGRVIEQGDASVILDKLSTV